MSRQFAVSVYTA